MVWIVLLELLIELQREVTVNIFLFIPAHQQNVRPVNQLRLTLNKKRYLIRLIYLSARTRAHVFVLNR